MIAPLALGDSHEGDEATNSLGYNVGNALGAISAKGRLVNAVVKDIEGKK